MAPDGPHPGPARLRAALHPLDAPPAGMGWNHDDLADLLPEGLPLREAAVLVGLVARADAWQVLLTRRTDALRHHAGQVSFPGGRIEPGDGDALAAALRETGEEVGIPSGQIAPLGFLDPLATITGFRILPVVALLDAEHVPHPDPNEVAEVFEVPLDYLLHPENLATLMVERRGRQRPVLEYRYPGQRIWGATASILLNLRERLGRLDPGHGGA
jgi:8-oxo-dGTP pyrophosphatase MutT (NUDIX family)